MMVIKNIRILIISLLFSSLFVSCDFINKLMGKSPKTSQSTNNVKTKDIKKMSNLEFLKENKKKEGVKVTSSGLQYKVIKQGSGKSPRLTDRVEVHYKGTLIDGTEFDSSYARGEKITFALNRVIKGWTEGLQLMQEGSKYELYIPSDLAYGDNDVAGIPASSTLIFTVELFRVL